jgi:Spy/CpxP family protein refolding chaperone
VNLSADQVASLEKLSKDQGDELEKLERDAGISQRDLRTLLESDQPAAADIVAAGNRIRAMRDTVFDRQLQMLAAERTILTKAQWQILQTQMESRQSDRQRGRSGYPGGRGGFPGRGGRRPGYPG